MATWHRGGYIYIDDIVDIYTGSDEEADDCSDVYSANKDDAINISIYSDDSDQDGSSGCNMLSYEWVMPITCCVRVNSEDSCNLDDIRLHTLGSNVLEGDSRLMVLDSGSGAHVLKSADVFQEVRNLSGSAVPLVQGIYGEATATATQAGMLGDMGS